MKIMFYGSRAIVFFILIAKVSLKEIKAVTQNDTRNWSTTNCIEHLVEISVPCGSPLTLVNIDERTEDFIESVNGHQCYSIILRNSTHCRTWTMNFVYIISVNDLKELRTFMECISQDVFWDPSKLFIIALQKPTTKENMLADYFRILLKLNVFNVTVLVNDKEATSIYTYYPFDNGGCGKTVNNVVNVGDCNSVKKHATDFLPNSASVELRNCKIVVTQNEDVPNVIYVDSEYVLHGVYTVGIEQLIIEDVARGHNLTLEFIAVNMDERYGIVLPNGTATGGLRYLQSGKADIASGGFMLITNRAKKFDFAWGYHFSTYAIYTHAITEYRWAYMYKEFSNGTWLMIGLAFIAVTMFTFLLRQMSSKSTRYGYVYIVINLWAYFFSNTSEKLNKLKTFRHIMFWWIWFTFFLSNFYSSALYSLISSNWLPKESKDLQYLVDNGYTPCISRGSREFFIFTFNQTLPAAPYKEECEVAEDSFKTVAVDPTSYAVEPDYTYKLRICEYLDLEGNPLLDDWYFYGNLITSLYFDRGSPLRDIFQNYIRIMFDAGFFQKQMRDISLPHDLLCQRSSKAFHKFNMKDMRIAFFVLVCGSVVSFVVFLLEMFLGK